MDKPLVTVVIPAWNQEVLVYDALDSIPKRKDIEIVICNDASTDTTNDTINKFITLNKDYFYNIIYLTNEVNRGVGYTINRCYDAATAEYVVALGSDDYFYTSTFEEAMKFLDGTDMVYFNLQKNDGGFMILTPASKTSLCGSTKFIRRDFMGSTRCPDKRAAEDWDFYQDLLKKNPTETFTNLTVKHYNFPREGSLYDRFVKGVALHDNEND